MTTDLEAILFAAAKPIGFSALQKALNVSAPVLLEALEDLGRRFNSETSGIHLLIHEEKAQFVTNPASTEAVAGFVKQEALGDLTQPQLETLTVIAYRGPITKPELEEIRGVNCSLILRNLAVRGLVDEVDSVEKLQPVYTVSNDFLRHLGLTYIQDLPEYESLHAHERITELMDRSRAPSEEPSV